MLKTIRAENMEEKTLRYPGHAMIIKALREMKLLSDEYRDLTAKLLFPLWEMKPEEGDRDITIMWVKVEGTGKEEERITLEWELFDRFDEKSKIHSMARTTAFPCAIVARLIAEGEITNEGVIPPEKLGMDEGLYSKIMWELRKRGIKIKEKVIVERELV
ncbi:MAG: hypothetical protein J7M13_09175 [Synergistetes bacterium]|nr:hypothetical protein [Synergistota bacterium]